MAIHIDPGGPLAPTTLTTGYKKKPPLFSWNRLVSSYNSVFEHVADLISVSGHNERPQPACYNHQCFDHAENSCRKYQHESTDVSRDNRNAIDIPSAPAGQHEHKECHQSSVLNRSCTVSSFSGLYDGQLWQDSKMLQQAPQNTSDWVYKIYAPAEQDKDLEAALDNLSDGKAQTKGLIICSLTNLKEHIASPISWQYVLGSEKHYQDSVYASYAPFNLFAELLEKAVLRRSLSGRYVGLFPHSADPPLHNTQTIRIPEYPHTANNNNSTSNHPAQLYGEHNPATLLSRLIAYFLQLSRALASTIIDSLPKRFKMDFSPDTEWILEFDPNLITSDFEIGTFISDIESTPLSSEPSLGDSLPQSPIFLNIPNEHYIPDSPLYTNDPITFHTFHPAQDMDYSQFPPQQPSDANSFFFSPTPVQTISPIQATNGDMESLMEYLTFPPSPTPPLAEVENRKQSWSEDPNPGLTPEMSDCVSPQTEGPNTPALSLRSSPGSASPPQCTSRRQSWICDEESCGHRQFTRRCDLNKHLKTHKKDLLCRHSAEGCSYRAATEKDRRRHERTRHQGDKPFVCELCEPGGRRFSRSDNLKDHQRRMHGAKR